MRRHRLAERLLVDVIGLEWEKVHKEADRWEHAISADVEEKLVAAPRRPGHLPARQPDPRLAATRSRARRRCRSSQSAARARSIVRRISEKIEIDDDAIVFLAGAELIPGSNAVVVSTSTDGVQVKSAARRADRPPQARPAHVRRPRLTRLARCVAEYLRHSCSLSCDATFVRWLGAC